MARVLATIYALALFGRSSHAESPDDDFSLLQVGLGSKLQLDREDMDPFAPLEHYWPHIRGHLGRYGITEYPMVIPSSGNLSESLLWSKELFGEMLWSVVIDQERNIYLAAMGGLRKLTPQGEVLWTYPKPTIYAVLVGNAVCGQTMFGGRSVFCLSLKTGRPFWDREVFPITGLGGNQIESNKGVLMVAAGEMEVPGLTLMTGKSNDRIIGLNASTGRELWQFKVSCGMWMFMGLFPDEDTTVFQDQCGGVYRVGLFNGSLVWYTPGAPGTLSDGAAILGPDGSTYGCSMPEGARLEDNNDPLYPGVLRKVRLSDGAVLWTATTPYPCTNIPTVTADGSTVVVAPGAIPAVDGPFYYQRKQYLDLPPAERERVHQLYDRMQRTSGAEGLRAYMNMTDLTGAIMGYDTRTGEVRWRHEVPPSGSITAAGDQERNYDFFITKGFGSVNDLMARADELMADPSKLPGLPHCGPAHWTSPTLDLQGRVYIGDSVGEIRVLDPKTNKRLDFHLDDGFVPSGSASAPGLMVIAACETIFAFKAQGA